MYYQFCSDGSCECISCIINVVALIQCWCWCHVGFILIYNMLWWVWSVFTVDACVQKKKTWVKKVQQMHFFDTYRALCLIFSHNAYHHAMFNLMRRMTNNYSIILFFFAATRVVAFIFTPRRLVWPCESEMTSLFTWTRSYQLDLEHGYKDAQMWMLRCDNEPYNNLLQKMKPLDAMDNEIVVVRRNK